MKLGICVGRWQVPELHEGHKKLIDQAIEENDTIAIVVCEGNINDDRNPYTANERRIMIGNIYPDIQLITLLDEHSDVDWSNTLDQYIQECLEHIFGMVGAEVTLYHGRDSFKDYYSGIYTTKEIESIPGVSGTEIRKKLKSKVNE